MKVVLIAALASVALSAQTTRLVIDGKKIVLNGESVKFFGEMNVGATLTGAPYSAEALTESTQTLYDGNRITQRSSVKQYRDTEGRERREEGGMNTVFINDPVAKVSYTLHPESMTAQKSDLECKKCFFTGVISKDVAGMHSKFVIDGTAKDPAEKQEDLGTRMIEGVQAQGSRTTTTIAAGTIGNERTIEIVNETWFSPELQLTVLSRHADPRTGENVYRLTNIQRLEQVRSLFEVPRSYTIRDAESEKLIELKKVKAAGGKEE